MLTMQIPEIHWNLLPTKYTVLWHSYLLKRIYDAKVVNSQKREHNIDNVFDENPMETTITNGRCPVR